jgi:hypothetical protein
MFRVFFSGENNFKKLISAGGFLCWLATKSCHIMLNLTFTTAAVTAASSSSSSSSPSRRRHYSNSIILSRPSLVASSSSSKKSTRGGVRVSSSASEQQQPAKIQETYQFHSPGKVTFAHETDEEKPKWTNCEISHVGDVNEGVNVKLGVVIGTFRFSFFFFFFYSLSLLQQQQQQQINNKLYDIK